MFMVHEIIIVRQEILIIIIIIIIVAKTKFVIFTFFIFWSNSLYNRIFVSIQGNKFSGILVKQIFR